MNVNEHIWLWNHASIHVLDVRHVMMELGEQLHVRALFLQFVYELLWQMDRQGITTVKPDLITQAIRYIHDKFPESLSLDSIAQALNYNVHYFSRKFKRQMGQSPTAYLIQVRMEHAQNLLLNTNATLQEIAERVGYTDLYYFIRIFKKHAGLSPGKYRDSMLI